MKTSRVHPTNIRTRTIRITSANGNVVKIYHQIFYNIWGEVVEKETGWFIVVKSKGITTTMKAKHVFIDNEFWIPNSKDGRVLLIHTGSFGINEVFIHDVESITLDEPKERYKYYRHIRGLRRYDNEIYSQCLWKALPL